MRLENLSGFLPNKSNNKCQANKPNKRMRETERDSLLQQIKKSINICGKCCQANTLWQIPSVLTVKIPTEKREKKDCQEKIEVEKIPRQQMQYGMLKELGERNTAESVTTLRMSTSGRVQTCTCSPLSPYFILPPSMACAFIAWSSNMDQISCCKQYNSLPKKYTDCCLDVCVCACVYRILDKSMR